MIFERDIIFQYIFDYKTDSENSLGEIAKLSIFLKETYKYHPNAEIMVTEDKVHIELNENFIANKQQATSNKQQATSNKQQATSNKQQATSNKQQNKFIKGIQFCRDGDYLKAKKIFDELIKSENPQSEYFRNYGQILFDEQSFEEAENMFIEAIKLDKANAAAYVMIGNIYGQHKRDAETAEKYYKEAVRYNPQAYFAYNNLSAVLAQKGKIDLALAITEKCIEINPQLFNAIYTKALILKNEGKLLQAFNFLTNHLADFPNNQHLKNLFTQIAIEYIAINDGSEIYNQYRKKLEAYTEKKIEIQQDESINTFARIEIAEYKNRRNHIVKTKGDNNENAHLIMHELVHLDLIEQARTNKDNKLFITTEFQKKKFIDKCYKSKVKFHDYIQSQEQINGFLDVLFNGLMLQIYNAPIDLVIEEFLFNNFEVLRPYQFISILKMQQESLKGYHDHSTKGLIPPFIFQANTAMNYTHLIQLNKLFGYNLLDEIKELKYKKIGEVLYSQFEQIKFDREFGEEYDLIEWWAEDLELTDFFTLVEEEVYNNKATDDDDNIEEILKDAQNSAFDELTDQFIKEQEALGFNMAVVMYMIEAIQYFKSKNMEATKKIAIEIATLGMNGISPDENYQLTSFGNKEFTGYQMLSFYYVSWAMAMPEMLQQLRLPFDKEYEMAQNLQKSK